MKDIRFSIVIPAYNASKSIVKTLDCVAAQTYQNFEVIIIDDKSADANELAAMVNGERYNQLSITLVLSEEKLNGAGARNKGIELASGDYVSFLDADDDWRHDKLQVCAEKITALEEQGKENFILYSQVNIYEDDRFLKIMPVQAVAPGESVAEYLFGLYGFIQTSTIVLKREYAEKIKFDARYIRHQDYDFCIRADKLHFEFIMLAEPLSNYYMVTTHNSKHKGESVKYSFFWLESMKPFLTQRETYTYKAYKLPIRYKMDGQKLRASLSFMSYFFLTDRTNRHYFIGRLKEKVYSRILGR